MKWYETPIEDLYERALLAMDRRTRVYGLGAGYWK